MAILSTLFKIRQQEIFITDDVCNLHLALDDSIKIVYEKTKIQGDFKIKISIYLKATNLERYGYGDRYIFARFCNLFKCKCLISDDCYNPYSWILLESNDRQYSVSLIPEKLDREIYAIAVN